MADHLEGSAQGVIITAGCTDCVVWMRTRSHTVYACVSALG